MLGATAVLNEMRSLLTKYTRITEERFQAVTSQLDNPELLNALVEFRSNEYAELYRIFRLPIDIDDSDEVGYALWNRYFENKRYHLIEMRMLRAQAKKCLAKWLTFPKDNKSEKKKKNHKDSHQSNTERINN